MEKSNNERVLVVESDDALRRSIVSVLSDAGYEVSTDCGEGMKFVLSFRPDVVILGADPPQLDCCDLLSEIKGSERTQNIHVVMLSPGGSAQRTRGLDLGADDVLSLPFDPHELLSRVRWQLRNKQTIENLGQQARTVEESLTSEKISSDADVALLKGSISEPKIKKIAFADGHRFAVVGRPVILLGYPTGLDAILARTGEETLRSIASTTKGDPKEVMEELARRRLIRPVVTQGHRRRPARQDHLRCPNDLRWVWRASFQLARAKSSVLTLPGCATSADRISQSP